MSLSAPAAPSRARRRWEGVSRWVWAVALVGVVLVAAAIWFLLSIRTLRPAVDALKVDAAALQSDVQSGRFVQAGATLTKVRQDAETIHSATSGPVWTVAAHLPGVGDDVQAVRTIAQVGSDVTRATQPLETALPQLSPEAMREQGGGIDTSAISQVASAAPAVSAAVSQGSQRLDRIDTSGLMGAIASGVEQVRRPLDGAVGPLQSAEAMLPHLPAMLGADGKRTYFVMLEQDAEARGTGGLVGSYALISFDHGKLSLVRTAARGTLEDVPIPSTTAVPAELQSLWSTDLDEWAGLNLSPHFPWTGQLVEAGWKARRGSPQIDGVIGVDANVVAGLLAGTGPLSSAGLQLTSSNVVTMLGRDIYAKYADPHQVDAATGAIVQSVFTKLAAGDFDLGKLVAALKKPYSERRLVMWSADSAEEQALARVPLGGALPDKPGPFAMTVINNGGGNKLDAYLKVATTFDPGGCTGGVRVGAMTVDLTNSAPTSGLPEYVVERNDLKDQGKTNPVVGSTRVLVDLYTAVGSQVPLVLQDDRALPIVVSGVDRGHTVTRVAVTIDPGHKLTLNATVVDAATSTSGAATTMTQPMFNPQTISSAPVTACAS